MEPAIRLVNPAAAPADETDATEAPVRADGPLDWQHWPPAPDRAARGALPLKGLPGDPERLAERTALVLGLGAVGGIVLPQLARLGVGTLIGVDPDAYEQDSWQTQPCGPAQAGRAKAAVIGAAAHAVNPGVTVATARGLAQDLPLRVLRQADVLIAAGDNLQLIVWAGVWAGRLGKVLIQGAVHGETATCLVRAYDRREPDGPCPGCQLRGQWQQLADRHGCDPRDHGRPGQQQATRTNPAVCHTAGQLVAHEALKWLAAQGEHALRDEELAISLVGYRPLRSRLLRSDCRCPHERWTLVDLEEGPAAVTLGELLPRAATEPSALTLIRAEQPWVGQMECAACGRSGRLARFARPGQLLGRCACGAPLVAQRLDSRSHLPPGELAACRDRPLAELGIAPGEALTVHTGESCTAYFLAGGPPWRCARQLPPPAAPTHERSPR